jgi:AcrR family transcriptional regulator
LPKQTFHNLPKEKRELITNAAIEEFAEYGFEAASINRIVANSGIAKGSFYQYFEDKMDVFRHLIDELSREKAEFFKDKHPPAQGQSVFEYFRWMIKSGMEFNSAYPRMVQGVSRVLFVEGLYYGKFFEEHHKLATNAFTAMIKQAMKLGEVDPSIDVELAVMVMETWSNAITTYILNEGMKQKDIMKWVRSAKTQEKIDKLLYVMEYGLRKTESQFEKQF